MIASAVRAELGRVVDQTLKPIRTEVEDTITRAAQQAAAPVRARIERLVGDTAQKAVAAVLDTLLPPRGRR
jgi:hypothetical protein